MQVAFMVKTEIMLTEALWPFELKHFGQPDDSLRNKPCVINYFHRHQCIYLYIPPI